MCDHGVVLSKFHAIAAFGLQLGLDQGDVAARLGHGAGHIAVIAAAGVVVFHKAVEPVDLPIVGIVQRSVARIMAAARDTLFEPA